ncbi:MAG: hypothetical protein KF888_04510 [Nitrosomonas sp.]|nr:hypothetical protein [Nitrosomonas sp.]
MERIEQQGNITTGRFQNSQFISLNEVLFKKEKQLWLLVGGNSAGITTFYRLGPLGMSFVNTDILAKQLHPDQPEQYSYEATKIAETFVCGFYRAGAHFVLKPFFLIPLRSILLSM